MSTCGDCNRSDDQGLLMVVADLGDGAFVAVLCDLCWHRRKYRAELEARRAALRSDDQPEDLNDVLLK